MTEHQKRWAFMWQVPALYLLVKDLEKLLNHVPEGYTGRYTMTLTYKNGTIVAFHAKDAPLDDVEDMAPAVDATVLTGDPGEVSEAGDRLGAVTSGDEG